jgi:hypothetical protein
VVPARALLIETHPAFAATRDALASGIEAPARNLVVSAEVFAAMRKGLDEARGDLAVARVENAVLLLHQLERGEPQPESMPTGLRRLEPGDAT